MTIYSIYKATCVLTGKSYIGYDENWDKSYNRRYDHETISFNKKSGEYYYEFHKAIRQFGPENFHWEILYQSLDCEHTLNEMETHFVRTYNSYYKWDNGGYNMTFGGDAPFKGKTHSQEVKDKQSKLMKGVPKTQQQKDKMSESRKAYWTSP